MVSVCLLLPSYLGFSFLGHGVSLHGCSSKAQSLLLTLDERYLLTTAPSSANFFGHKHSPHKQVSDNNPSHVLKLQPTCSSWNILCKDPWTNVNGYFIDYFLGTTAEGFVLSHASLKNNKHLNIISSQLNWRQERTSQNHKR